MNPTHRRQPTPARGPAQLWLVRHGESEWNREGRLQGQTPHVKLTPLGQQQAAMAAARLAASTVGRQVSVVSSDLVRARQTATVIADVLGVAVRLDPRLREQALGSLEGCLTRDLREQPVPDGLHISEVAWGGGESVRQVHERCAGFLADLDTSADVVVVVSHGDTLRIMLAVLSGLGHREVVWRPIGSAEVIGPLPGPLGWSA